MSRRVLVIGAGASGLMAAAAAAGQGCRVTVLEKNEKAGKKIYITGKGRCNLTNNCDPEAFFAHVVRNPKFLYSSYYGFDREAVMDFFEENGCPVKTERGGRVFPVSDHASDVTAALLRRLRELHVEIRYHAEVRRLLTEPVTQLPEAQELPEAGRKGKKQKGPQHRVLGAELASGEILQADAVILCTGGLSYPSTGSTGDGLVWAEALGLACTPAAPSLVPFAVAEPWCAQLQGLALKNVSLRISDPAGAGTGKKKHRPLYEGFGEMLFTHFGISGPLVLSASAVCEADQRGPLSAVIDLKPALTQEQLRARLDRDFSESPQKSLRNVLRGLLPARLSETVTDLFCEAESAAEPDGPLPDPEMRCASLPARRRDRLAAFLKAVPLTITGTRGFGEAVVTRGGISVKEIDPSTMQVKRVEGLYAAGELLDVDAYTGGFNLQIAWSTGHLAGASVR